jgi:hypothetical protein
MVDRMFAPGGPYEVLLDVDNIVVGKRVGEDPLVDVEPQAAACSALERN